MLRNDRLYRRQFAGCLILIGIGCSFGILKSTQPANTKESGEVAVVRQRAMEAEDIETDQRGALGNLTAADVLKAAQLIKKGQVLELGRVYELGIPLFGKRHLSLTLSGSPTGGPLGTNRLVYHDEMFSGEIGQIGTQLDGLGHIAIRDATGEDVFYGGFKASEIRKAYGLSKLGIENAGHFFTRGVLLDVASVKGVEALPEEYIITVRDIEGTLEKQGVKIRAGDAVLIRTGHGRWWKVNNSRYNASEPGPGTTAIRWLIEQKVVLVGADNWGFEAVPGETPERAFEGHELLLQQNGIYILENLNLDKLAEEEVYEFAFILAPLPLKGATGSPANPLAVW